MSLLTPDIGLLFWMTLSFGIVFFILAKYGFPVILKAVDKRTAYINNSLETAAKAEEKLANIQQEAETIIRRAQEERAKILNEAGELRNRILDDAKEEAEKGRQIRINKTTSEIEELKRKALSEVRNEIADISLRIAEKVVREELRKEEKQQQLIDHLLDEEILYKN
ncbi:MAG: F0F1 ATP synthase subunit B [Massilibacteroides sp.]|nr:F0F1 ATP synthase subunit B [Massilibacteroides sp.]MDD3063656.1 F0F1 ATP synthase subunit B [Massilibacteroides sp.]MDD4114790.1 F0F1 ATP synthase subunit B [Massilibacteroides sp.]MDD4661195.1 F0F1 ATP synthase subunit B [Massilibacteroides sp.]